MSIFTSKNHYQTIDGEDDAGPLIDNSPPTSHHIDVDVDYQNPGRKRQASVSISRGSNRWDHIENLDQFFHLVYEYHQNHGYVCLALRHFFAIFQFVFVVVFSTFMFQCVDYDVLFKNKATDSQGRNITGTKRTISNALVADCPSHFSPVIVLSLMAAALVLFFYIVHFLYQMLRYREIQEFYNSVLEIPDSELCNVTWRTVVKKICEVQPKVHLSVNQATISELDIYARILRHKNFFIAMIYEDVIPPHLTLPGLGSVPYFPASMKFNLELLLFKGSWSPWKNHFQLKDDYKDISNLDRLGNDLRSKIIYAALISLIFMPFIFIYQILFSFFSYADLAKREPGIFSMRKYSNYGREKLRHFNELDHELKLRLNRSYEFSVRYMDQFVSPVLEIVAKYFAFIAASLFAVLFILGVWDEDFLTIEHVLTVLSVSGGIVFICRAFIVDENMVFCPDFLMKQIVCNIHYAPESWLREAQSTEVVAEFGKLFHMTAYALVLDVISPIVTPFILFFSTSMKAHQIVQFFHERTKSVPELGDVCSYALMDLKEGGEEALQDLQSTDAPNSIPRHPGPFTPKRTARGKIELSLLNFATQNPDWKPPPTAQQFITHIREKTKETGIGQNLMLHSLKDLERPIIHGFEQSIFNTLPGTSGDMSTSGMPQSMIASHMSDGTNDMGQMSPIEQSMMTSVMGKHYAQPRRLQETNIQAVQMSMNALLLNNLMMSSHHRRGNDRSNPRMGAYGSFAPLDDQPSNLQEMSGMIQHNESAHEDESHDDLSPLISPNSPQNQQAESNIWGIPSQSQFQSRYSDGGY